MIPSPSTVATDPIARYFHELFATIDWRTMPARDPQRPGPHPIALEVYLKTLLVKLDRRLPSGAALRQYLLEHPALQWELGYRPRGGHPPVPSSRWLNAQQQRLGDQVAALLHTSVRTLAQVVPDLDAMTALDATHHLACVKHNNPNQSVAQRFEATQHPAGDPDCRLGAKTVHTAPDQSKKLAFWGYHSLIVAAQTTAGPVVLGAQVQPVVAQEVQLVRPVMAQVEAALGHPPAGLSADAAFDAWWIWNWVVADGGVAAIAPNPRRGAPARSVDGHPICDAGYAMRRCWTGTYRGHAAGGYGCPLRDLPQATCTDPRVVRGGCHKTINLEPGGLARIEIDRTSAVYQAAYAQRTVAERVFALIKGWGLGRIKVRRLASVRTVIMTGYLLLNLQALHHLAHPTSVRE